MKSLDDKQLAEVSIACARYTSHNSDDDERIGSIVADQLRHIPRALAYCCAVEALRQRRMEWRRRIFSK